MDRVAPNTPSVDQQQGSAARLGENGGKTSTTAAGPKEAAPRKKRARAVTSAPRENAAVVETESIAAGLSCCEFNVWSFQILFDPSGSSKLMFHRLPAVSSWFEFQSNHIYAYIYCSSIMFRSDHCVCTVLTRGRRNSSLPFICGGGCTSIRCCSMMPVLSACLSCA